MNDKQKLFIVILGLAIAYAAGMYTDRVVETKVTKIQSTKTESQELDKKDKNTHKVTKTVTIKAKDGSSTTTVTTDTTTEVKDIDKKESETLKKSKTVTDTKSAGKLNISLLASYDLMNPKVPAVGLSVSKEVLGPVTAGVWGLNSGIIGISIGLDF